MAKFVKSDVVVVPFPFSDRYDTAYQGPMNLDFRAGTHESIDRC